MRTKRALQWYSSVAALDFQDSVNRAYPALSALPFSFDKAGFIQHLYVLLHRPSCDGKHISKFPNEMGSFRDNLVNVEADGMREGFELAAP